MTFIQEEYPTQYSRMMIEEEMLPFVENRVIEAKKLMHQVENAYYQDHKEKNPDNIMERTQALTEARNIAMEIIKKEVLLRKLM